METLLTSAKRFLFVVSLMMGIISGVAPAWAWPPTYGAEFEVSRPGLGTYDFSKKNPTGSPEKLEQERFIEHMRERCITAGCTVVPVKGKWDVDYRVEYPDGWYFKVSYDPACVEITFKPSSQEMIQARIEIINDHIFETAKQVGLSVKDPKTNNSHFNMGIRSAFNDNAKSFLRFFIDYSNRPDLGLGGLGTDIYNAPPLAVLGSEQRAALKQIVAEVEANKLTTIAEVAAAIQNRVYTRSYYAPWGGIHHYQAIGLKYVNRTDLSVQDAPFEIRAMRIQESAEKFILIARLFEGRISYLNNLKTPLVYTETAMSKFTNSQLRTRFKMYVEEAGLKYEDFSPLLNEEIHKAALDPILDKSLPIEDRLKNVADYWDLIPASELMQKTVADLLISSQGSSSKTRLEILQRLKKEAGILPLEKSVLSYLNPFKKAPAAPTDALKMTLAKVVYAVENQQPLAVTSGVMCSLIWL